jgi:glycine cleavage system aminomethyltransferase T
MTTAAMRRHPLYPNVRRSPYFARTEAEGATEYIVYNHMYMPMAYGRDPRQDYRALTERVTLWDVGAERQTEIRGPDARAFADMLTTRRLDDLRTGECRYTLCCDDDGEIICDPILLAPEDDVIWLSHGTVDLTLWARGLATGGSYDVEVLEPDVAPMQVQGPLSPAVMRSLIGEAIDDLRPFQCMQVTLAGVDCIVSRTGWSGGAGFEIYPRGTERALDLWDAVKAAGEPHDLLVIGPNLSKAMESGITDTSYATNQDLNPLELWQDYLVDLDKGNFIGREALQRINDKGVSRRQVGLLGPGSRLPTRLEWPWDIRVGEGTIGSTRWLTYSLGLDRLIAIGVVDVGFSAVGTPVDVVHPEGIAAMEIVELPFVR